MKRTATCTLAALCFAASAAAQSLDFGPGVFADGFVEASYLDGPGFDDRLIWTRSNFGYRPGPGDSAIGLGFSLGIDAYATRGRSESALYPTVELSGRWGRISAGIPRSVLDSGYLPEPPYAHSSLTDLQFQTLFGSLVSVNYLLIGEQPRGLRYDGAFGATRGGASWHRFSNGALDTDIYALALQHRFNAISAGVDLTVSAGVEHVTNFLGSETLYRAGIEAEAKRLHAGAFLAEGLFPFPDSTLSTVYGGYDLTERLSADLAWVSLSGGPGQDLYALGLRYDLTEHAYLDLSHTRPESGSGSLTEITLGWEF